MLGRLGRLRNWAPLIFLILRLNECIEMELNAWGQDPEKKKGVEKVLANLDGIGWDRKKKRAVTLGWNFTPMDTRSLACSVS